MQTTPYANQTICKPNHMQTKPYAKPNYMQTKPYANETICKPNHMQIKPYATKPYENKTICKPNQMQTKPYAHNTICKKQRHHMQTKQYAN